MGDARGSEAPDWGAADGEVTTQGAGAAPAPVQRSRRPMLGLLVVFLSLIVVFNRSRQAAGQYLGHRYDPPLAAADFSLTDMRGQAFQMAAAKDQVRLLFFGYTSCPDICPATMGRVAAALARLDPGDREKVRVLFISVDPERDTPARLSTFLAGYGPEFLGLTGEYAVLQATAAAYFGTFYEEPAADGQTRLITHSGNLYLIDRQGQILESFTDPFDPADLAHDITLALR